MKDLKIIKYYVSKEDGCLQLVYSLLISIEISNAIVLLRPPGTSQRQ